MGILPAIPKTKDPLFDNPNILCGTGVILLTKCNNALIRILAY